MEDGVLHVGERNRAWWYPGDGDPVGGYEGRFISTKAAATTTAWAPLTSGVGRRGAGYYCWVVGVAVDVPEAGDVPLVLGGHRSQIRYTSGRLIDIDDTDTILVKP